MAGMVDALWVVLPYAAVVSCVVGHVWRFRFDGFLSGLYGPHVDRAQRFGIRALHVGLPTIAAERFVEMLLSGPHSRPGPAFRVLLGAMQLVGVPLAITGAALILVPPLITADRRTRITPLDRMTIPLLIAALGSAVLVTFDANSSVGRYRTAETLFAWVRSLVMLHPDPQVMHHAPVIYQARGLILMLIIAVWPYTRLAGVLTVPALRVLRQHDHGPRAERYPSAPIV